MKHPAYSFIHKKNLPGFGFIFADPVLHTRKIAGMIKFLLLPSCKAKIDKAVSIDTFTLRRDSG